MTLHLVDEGGTYNSEGAFIGFWAQFQFNDIQNNLVLSYNHTGVIGITWTSDRHRQGGWVKTNWIPVCL